METLKQGATDFVLKDHFSRLGQAVKRALEEKETSDKRKEIEEDLLSYRRLFNLSLDLLCIIGFDGKFKKINPVFQSTLGYSEEEILGKLVIDFVHEKDIERTETDFKAQRDGKPTIQFENRFLCKDGQYNGCHGLPGLISTGGFFILRLGTLLTRNRLKWTSGLKIGPLVLPVMD